MKVPLSWLKDYVDFDWSAPELADRLTFAGLEVEEVAVIGADCPGVVAGEVRAIDRHPNADKLSVCRVYDGREELTVVCGASNFGVGDKVPFAPAGVRLPNGMQIKAAKLRGVASAGMLCAEDELGLSDDHSGLMILPRATAAGTPLRDVIGAPEAVLVIEVTPNRPDCLSMIGMAREVAALVGRPLRLPDISLVETMPVVDTLTSVTIADEIGCPRYTARVIRGVVIGPSPRWMQQRLTWAGVRPINNIVDITNYVMLECGQPLHAFDQDLLSGGRIVVRRAAAGESLATLDGTPRPVTPAMLMIADAEKPVAVAGIMGGAGSEIRDHTTTVLLESACFKPTDIRKTSKQLGLQTESSYRFERGVDPLLADWASRRAAALMAECGGGQVAHGVIDCFPRPVTPRHLSMRFAKARALIGVALPDERMVAILNSLELRVGSRNADTCVATVPTFRMDLEREADLIEEVARIHGLENIPAPSPASRLVPGADDRPTRAQAVCRTHLVGLGLTEIVNYSFVSDKLLNTFNAGDAARRVVLPNPISVEHTTLRHTLIPQMIVTLGQNRAHQVATTACFELGRVFFQDEGGQDGEETRLCVGLMGPCGRVALEKPGAPRDTEIFEWAKGLLEELCRALRLPAVQAGGLSRPDVEYQPAAVPYYEDGRAVAILAAGNPCGSLGIVKAGILAEWRIGDPVAVFEISIAPLLTRVFETPTLKPVPIYPAVERDLTFLVADAVRHEDIMAVVRRQAPVELIDARLYDIYHGASIGPGRKSMTYRFTYQSPQRTLTDEAANVLHDAIMQAVKEALRAEIRA